VSYPSSLELGETHQLGTQTEACTLASREADGGREQVQEREGDRGDDGDSQNLLNVQLLLGDDEGRQGNGQTLEEILDSACHELSNSETVHLIFRAPKIIRDGRVRSYDSV
jgi:hypothetical protein